MRQVVTLAALVTAFAVAGCGGDETTQAGSMTNAAVPSSTKASPAPLTNAEQEWLPALQAYTGELLTGLVQLERVTGGNWPDSGQDIELKLDRRVYDKDSDQFLFFMAASEGLLRCDKKMARDVPAAPTPRTRSVRKLVANACDEFALALATLGNNVFLHEVLGDADAAQIGSASAGINAGMRLMQDAGRMLPPR